MEEERPQATPSTGSGWQSARQKSRQATANSRQIKQKQKKKGERVEKIERSLQIMKASWEILRQDKEILMFPMMSGLALILILASFAVPIFALGNVDTIERIARHNGTVGNLVVAFAFYFINYFVIVDLLVCGVGLGRVGLVVAEILPLALVELPVPFVGRNQRHD
ncbi:MAG: hypothetical protein L7F78_09020, partial [Syntrophales bacterium LBB04]|nr:hypothetical protein [Syntrophales bacterium LBB04]